MDSAHWSAGVPLQVAQQLSRGLGNQQGDVRDSTRTMTWAVAHRKAISFWQQLIYPTPSCAMHLACVHRAETLGGCPASKTPVRGRQPKRSMVLRSRRNQISSSTFLRFRQTRQPSHRPVRILACEDLYARPDVSLLAHLMLLSIAFAASRSFPMMARRKDVSRRFR
jgi:hypothetical protein